MTVKVKIIEIQCDLLIEIPEDGVLFDVSDVIREGNIGVLYWALFSFFMSNSPCLFSGERSSRTSFINTKNSSFLMTVHILKKVEELSLITEP